MYRMNHHQSLRKQIRDHATPDHKHNDTELNHEEKLTTSIRQPWLTPHVTKSHYGFHPHLISSACFEDFAPV